MLHDPMAKAQLTSEHQELLLRMQAELAEARSQIKQLETKITALQDEAAAERSILTRPEFNREVARMLAFDERYGGTSSVLYFDFASLDDLTTRHSSAFASEVIRTITTILTQHVRSSDIIGRLAVDEFGILLVRCNNDNAWKKGRDLAAALLPALKVVDGKNLGIDVSFGAYTFREEEDVATGLKEAAQALTKADKDK